MPTLANPQPFKLISYILAIALLVSIMVVPILGQTITGTIFGNCFGQWTLSFYGADSKLFGSNLEAGSSDYSGKFFSLAPPPPQVAD